MTSITALSDITLESSNIILTFVVIRYKFFAFKVSDVQMGNFFMYGKVLKTVYFLKGNNVENSN